MHEAVAAPVGARRCHRGGGAARLRLGDADGGLVAGQSTRPGGELFLLVGAIGQDRPDGAHVGFHRDAAAVTPQAFENLLDHQHGVEHGIHAGATP
jgi:hypothetical protein